MILQGIPDTLTIYASQTLLTLCLATKYTGKLIDMLDIINSISKEADHVKTHCVPKDQAPGKGKREGQTDEALAATSSSNCCNNNNTGKRHKGKCHHCSREGHWVQECRTKKKEATATVSNQSSQTAQASSGSTCHGLPSFLPNLFFPFSYSTPDAFPHAYLTYLWNILAFSRDFHKVLSPSMTFCYLLRRSSSFRDSHVYILYL